MNNIQDVAARIEKVWQSLYGSDVFVGYGNGINGYFLLAMSNDPLILDQLPSEVEGYLVRKESIPVAG